MSLFYVLFPNGVETGISIIALVYGLVLLFHSLNKKYSFVKFLYLPLFAFILGKLFFYDLVGFSTVQIIMVLIGSGVLLLGGSFLFLKLKQKYEEK